MGEVKGGVDALKTCAKRLEKLLASRPRSHKTREYLATLPKRARISVLAEDFISSQKVRAVDVVEKLPDEARKDKIRPRARSMESRWACRVGGYRHSVISGKKREPRAIEQVTQQRQTLNGAQDGLCALCGHEMLEELRNRSIDHTIPRSLGGKDDLGNLVLSHKECNGAKSNDIPTGCEMVWLLAINARLGVHPQHFPSTKDSNNG